MIHNMAASIPQRASTDAAKPGTLNAVTERPPLAA